MQPNKMYATYLVCYVYVIEDRIVLYTYVNAYIIYVEVFLRKY